ncbi:MAG: ATP-binding cassette domain-containing protein [Propionibacteriaceae bacterium]|jgi:putative ABC transport system ATP-binding protein|nr:ATP-binding cassette domain-containing protein [Propionibacteriaceae bacterium]
MTADSNSVPALAADPILRLDKIGYSYDGSALVLSNLTWDFQPGRLYGIIGRSGAGKTTLLSLLAGLAAPTAGTILFDGQDLSRLDRYRYRRRDVGVVFQSFNLLPHLTAVENVELSMRASGKPIPEKRATALALLDKVGLSEALAHRRILKLSGGEQQRVAIARALSYSPRVVLADEPTGNLDLATQDDIIDIMGALAEEGRCVIIVTHSPEVARCADQLYELKAAAVQGRRRRRPQGTA